MDELHKKILRENRSYIVNNIVDIESIIDGLLTKEVLTEGMKQDILEGENTPIKRARKLLDIIPKRGPFAFDIFCNILVEKQHRDLAERLNPSLQGAKTTPLAPSPSAPSAPISPSPFPVPTAVPIPTPAPHSSKKVHETSPVQPTATPPKPSLISEPGSLGSTNTTTSSSSGKPEAKSPQVENYGRRPSDKAFSPSDDTPPTDMISIDFPRGIDFTLSSKDFEVKRAEKTDLKRQLALDTYDVTQVKRGRAVVINNKYFEDDHLAERNENDSFRLQMVLKGLGFRCIVKSNLTRDEFFQELKKEKENDQLDMFVLVILSYGGAGTVLSRDMIEIPIPDILDVFSSTNCTALSGKPKLFFIQACGTKLKNLEIEPKSPDRADQATVEEISRCMKQLNLGPEDTDMVDTKRASTSDPLPLEETSDMLVAMATTPDQHNDKYSSLFILGLSYVLSNFAKSDHILELLKKVNQLKRDICTSRFEELCKVRHSLGRLLYFLPGHAPDEASIQDEDFHSIDSKPIAPGAKP